mmetsp:Transcript_11573/g.26789  ORF Transcript_11573/g.26789 Transcript_11573/m.26789 type:complete len:174 (-) Transcript_11573:764-1285(-)|eukprot:CAMPEP_0116831494 /NCGR_PEP_ID=MMETSP0418-20121206/5368_1 /TAXON_ID=1158023 /ORGANISM="Astrosyne radiata, Strain 13vi08-1A" /LENGTH=173 /DNA_ID=CAMNT_0004460751 /DNA_START=147 /DNA_END=668 /DNA_ORIENTATION=-
MYRTYNIHMAASPPPSPPTQKEVHTAKRKLVDYTKHRKPGRRPSTEDSSSSGQISSTSPTRRRLSNHHIPDELPTPPSRPPMRGSLPRNSIVKTFQALEKIDKVVALEEEPVDFLFKIQAPKESRRESSLEAECSNSWPSVHKRCSVTMCLEKAGLTPPSSKPTQKRQRKKSR